MVEFLLKLFDTSDFPRRWECGNWSDGHAWLHIVSDTAIATAYGAIPLIIVFFSWRRRDLPFFPVYILFALFIFSCGFGHFLEATIFWHPWYRLSGLTKAATAVVSWLTVIALIPMLPRALAWSGLTLANERLAAEIEDRRITESKLSEANEELQEFARSVISREDRIIELKLEINHLLREMGRTPRYSTEEVG